MKLGPTSKFLAQSVKARYLKPGDRVLAWDGELLRVKEIKDGMLGHGTTTIHFEDGNWSTVESKARITIVPRVEGES